MEAWVRRWFKFRLCVVVRMRSKVRSTSTGGLDPFRGLDCSTLARAGRTLRSHYPNRRDWGQRTGHSDRNGATERGSYKVVLSFRFPFPINCDSKRIARNVCEVVVASGVCVLVAVWDSWSDNH